MTFKKILLGGVAAAAVLAIVGGALALDEPKAGWKDKRVRFVDYDAHNIVRVVVAMRTSFLVVFAKEETIRDIGGGNTVAWEVAPAGNILFLKPRENHPTTNLQVVTVRADGSMRIYQMELSSVTGDRGDAAAFESLEYRYPSDESAAARDAARERQSAEDAGAAVRRLERDEARGPRNYQYTAQGSSAIEPAEVFDNGKITSFRFAGQQETPAIYLVGPDEGEQLVPSNVVGELTQVHAQGAKFVLRRGREVLCVFNENYHPAGLETGTKTTSPLVERVIARPKVRSLRPLTTMTPRPVRDDWVNPDQERVSAADHVPGRGAAVRERSVPQPAVVRPVEAPAARPVERAPERVVPSVNPPTTQNVDGPTLGDTIIVRGGAASGGQAKAGSGNIAEEIMRENMQ